jgi:hypothetical protein
MLIASFFLVEKCNPTTRRLNLLLRPIPQMALLVGATFAAVFKTVAEAVFPLAEGPFLKQPHRMLLIHLYNFSSNKILEEEEILTSEDFTEVGAVVFLTNRVRIPPIPGMLSHFSVLHPSQISHSCSQRPLLLRMLKQIPLVRGNPTSVLTVANLKLLALISVANRA